MPLHEKAWWQEAQELEAQGKFAEAERTILDAVPDLHAAMMVAELYSRRMQRLKSAGDESGAGEAFGNAEHWIYFFASQATSGGEGLALSRERDAFLRELVSALGDDPRKQVEYAAEMSSIIAPEVNKGLRP